MKKYKKYNRELLKNLESINLNNSKIYTRDRSKYKNIIVCISSVIIYNNIHNCNIDLQFNKVCDSYCIYKRHPCTDKPLYDK